MELKLRMTNKPFFIKVLLALVLMQVPTVLYAHKSNNERLDAIDARLQRLERVNTNQALVSMSQRIDALQREIQLLRGENEQLTHELNQLKARQREQFLALDRRMQSTSPTDINGTNSSDTVISNDRSQNTSTGSTDGNDDQQVATTTGTVISGTASNDAAQDYKNAFTLLKQGKYDDSIVAFNGFLLTHSDSKYASNAQYWLVG